MNDTQTGIMVALPLQDLFIASQTDLPGDPLPQSERHCTLLYFGKITDEGALPLVKYQTALESFNFLPYFPLVGTVGGGLGVFDTPDGYAYYLNVAIPGLAELRVDLTRHFATYGIVSPSVHGFSPHMTLTYSPKHVHLAPYKERAPVSVNHVWFSHGEENFIYPNESAFEHNKFEDRVLEDDLETHAEEVKEWKNTIQASADVQLNERFMESHEDTSWFVTGRFRGSEFIVKFPGNGTFSADSPHLEIELHRLLSTGHVSPTPFHGPVSVSKPYTEEMLLAAASRLFCDTPFRVQGAKIPEIPRAAVLKNRTY
jgi:2'-5' RNA ligase